MSLADRFQKAAPAAAPTAAKGPARNRWANVKAVEPQSSMPDVGVYRMRILEITEGYNPGKDRSSAKVKLEVVQSLDDATKVGNVHCYIELTSGKGSEFGRGRFKLFAMAAAGFEAANEDAFDDFDAGGTFLSHILGEENGRDETLVGALVDVEVKRGRDIVNPTTNQVIDYYRNYIWATVP